MPETIKRVTMRMPATLWKAFKLRALQEDVTLQDAAVTLITEWAEGRLPPLTDLKRNRNRSEPDPHGRP